MQKFYYTYEDIHRLVATMAQRIKASSFCPEAMVAVGAGGFIPARILRTFLNIPLYTITTAYYDTERQPTHAPQKIQWLAGAEKILAGKKILLVDEVDDSRVTLEYCLTELAKDGLSDIAVAVLHEKRKPKKGRLPENLPAYFSGVQVDDIWICYPWDAVDIDNHNLQTHEANSSL